jgi:DNA-binding PadR family transcriptional regulator
MDENSCRFLSQTQLILLHLILERNYRQNELHEKIQETMQKKMSAQNLSYHIGILEEEGLIEKRVIAQIGNARINEIAINPSQLQRIRSLLHIELQNYTLVTGFGRIEKGYLLPDVAAEALRAQHFRIDKVVCFTSQDAKAIREDKMKTEPLIAIDQYYDHYDYDLDYCNLGSRLYTHDLEEILRQELKSANLVLDLTPLSKLYSFTMLEFANRYHVPCFYLGKTAENRQTVIWVSGGKLLNTT